MAETRLRPIELVVLQGTSFCNLNCIYCDLSPESRRARRVMDAELIETAFTKLFESDYLAERLSIIWHSGEPLTLPPAYYEDAIRRILRLRDALTRRPVEIEFDIQTNGSLIDEAWCNFFKRHAAHLKVGVSCDGPACMHDRFRLNWNGRASHSKTLQGMDLLGEYGIKFKVIAVVTKATMSNPRAFFEFFHSRRESLSGFHFNILAQSDAANSELSYTAEDRSAYHDFYRALLNMGRRASNDGPQLEIENFTHGLARILRGQTESRPSYMEEGSAPLKSFNIDADGDVTTFYAGLAPRAHRDQYGDDNGLCIGNILEKSIEEMATSEKLGRITRDFALSTETCRMSCPYFAACPGGFELTKLSRNNRFDVADTPECIIHVQALADALLDDLSDHMERDQPLARAG